MEGDVLRDAEMIDGILEISSVLGLLFLTEIEQLLRINESHGTVIDQRDFKVLKILLEHGNVSGAPCYEHRIRTAPLEESLRNLLEEITLFKLLHLKMNELAGVVMHFSVDPGLDKFAEFRDQHSAFAVFYGSYLDDLKRDLGYFRL